MHHLYISSATLFDLLDSLCDYKQIRYIKTINKLITSSAVWKNNASWVFLEDKSL